MRNAIVTIKKLNGKNFNKKGDYFLKSGFFSGVN